ncbi:MAG: undecaprenyldiphospho-muramoylpentapeptide beta-N-acetylglucosaminyltransferase [Neisseriaceae bacterium]
MSCYLIMAGGTGGHIFPALAVARRLMNMGHEVVWLGSVNSMESRLVPTYGITLELIKIKGVRGNGWRRKLSLPWVLLRAIWAVRHIVKKYHISGVLGFGGFVSFPGGIAARLSRVPLVIHEQNAIAGLTNRFLARLAQQTFYAFPNTFSNSEGLVGNPVRENLVAMMHQSVEERFSKRSGRLKLFVVGGSLGAQIFNEKIPEILALVPEEKRPLVRHQCGRGNALKVKERYKNLNIEVEVLEFIEDMGREYEQADFVIARAGALTIAELTVVGLGGYLIPFPWAVDDHQTYNARYLVEGKAVVCIQQKDWSNKEMAEELSQLTRQQCEIWARNARQLAIIKADQKIADKMVRLSKTLE